MKWFLAFFFFISLMGTSSAKAFCHVDFAEIIRGIPYNSLVPKAEKAYEEWNDLYQAYQNRPNKNNEDFLMNPETAEPQMRELLRQMRRYQRTIPVAEPRFLIIHEMSNEGLQMIRDGIWYDAYIAFAFRLSAVVEGTPAALAGETILDYGDLKYLSDAKKSGFFLRVKPFKQNIDDYVAAHHLPLATLELSFKKDNYADGGYLPPYQLLFHDMGHARAVWDFIWSLWAKSKRRDVGAVIAQKHQQFLSFYRTLDNAPPLLNNSSILNLFYLGHEKDGWYNGEYWESVGGLALLTGNIKTFDYLNDLMADIKLGKMGRKYSVGSGYSHNHTSLYTLKDFQDSLDWLEAHYPKLLE